MDLFLLLSEVLEFYILKEGFVNIYIAQSL